MYYSSVPPSAAQLLSCSCQERLFGLRDVLKHLKNFRLLDILINNSSKSELGTPQVPMQVSHH